MSCGWIIRSKRGQAGIVPPLMHEALGTVKQGAVRFSFGYFNTEDDVQCAVKAVRNLAEEAE